MMLRKTYRGAMLAALAIVALALTACQSTGSKTASKALVEDFDSYQIVTLGPVRYVTPNGIEVVQAQGNTVAHRVDWLPDTKVVVSVDPKPPKDFKSDAEAQKRSFLAALNKSVLKSVQYDESDGRHKVKIFAEAETETGTPLSCALMIVRKGQNTATVQIIGPAAHRREINKFAEDIAGRLKLQEIPEGEGSFSFLGS